MNDDLARVFAFVVELDKLKAVLRKTRPVGFERRENSAEHSWQVCLLALALAEHAQPPVDAARVVELLLVHDVPEIDTDDRIVYQAQDADRQAQERAAAARIFGLLPAAAGERLLTRWDEFAARSTPEARFAYAMDRLMPLLHNLYGDGHSWREHAVPLARVLAVNAAIGDACPAAWDYARTHILRGAAAGLFDHDGDAAVAAAAQGASAQGASLSNQS